MKKILFIFFVIYILLIGLGQSNDKETKIEQPKEKQEEKKAYVDPNTVYPPPPIYHRCGADDLKIKPIVIDSRNIVPEKKDNN